MHARGFRAALRTGRALTRAAHVHALAGRQGLKRAGELGVLRDTPAELPPPQLPPGAAPRPDVDAAVQTDPSRPLMPPLELVRREEWDLSELAFQPGAAGGGAAGGSAAAEGAAQALADEAGLL
jgi:hypothetical protein